LRATGAVQTILWASHGRLAAVEESISRKSYEARLEVEKDVYGKSEEAGAEPSKRRKWAFCPECEIGGEML
jgi:hypothetical protein